MSTREDFFGLLTMRAQDILGSRSIFVPPLSCHQLHPPRYDEAVYKVNPGKSHRVRRKAMAGFYIYESTELVPSWVVARLFVHPQA